MPSDSFGADGVVLVGRQRHRCQDADDRHDDHQLDEGETLWATHHRSFGGERSLSGKTPAGWRAFSRLSALDGVSPSQRPHAALGRRVLGAAAVPARARWQQTDGSPAVVRRRAGAGPVDRALRGRQPGRRQRRSARTRCVWPLTPVGMPLPARRGDRARPRAHGVAAPVTLTSVDDACSTSRAVGLGVDGRSGGIRPAVLSVWNAFGRSCP